AEVVAPDALEDDRARQHLTRIAEEELEEGELGAGELDRVAPTPNLARPRLELEVAEPQGSVAAVRRSPEQRTQARQELREREGLRQVVVRACVETRDAAVDLGASGQHQDRNLVARGANPPADLEPVYTGHEDVEDDRVRMN